jgi:hypothetical protein
MVKSCGGPQRYSDSSYDTDTIPRPSTITDKPDWCISLPNMATSLDILQTYGDTQDLYDHTLTNALALADGTLPLVVLMQEPCNLADDVPYDIMVYGDEAAGEWSARRVGCPALQEIEWLAETASKGQYGLRDLHIFDLNTLLSQDLQADSQDLHNDLRQAHLTCWAMIQAEKPKVILVLTTSAKDSSVPKMTLFGSSLRKAGKTKTIEIWDNGRKHTTLVVYGFHPSVYLREDYVSNNRWSAAEVDSANNVLRLCFEYAFAFLENRHDEQEMEALLGDWRQHMTTRQQAKQQARQQLYAVEESLARLDIGPYQ